MSHYPLVERLRAWSSLLPLLALLAGTYWLSRQVLPLPAAPNYKARHDPDIIVEHFSAVSLNQQGTPHFLLAASKLVHYPDDDSTHLFDPRLTAPYRNKPPVHFTALHGEISHNGKQIWLSDDVKVVRDASASQSQLTITTSWLHVVPNAQTADTDRPLTLTDARGTITAVGMKLDSRARTLQLLSQVKSRYEPATR